MLWGFFKKMVIADTLAPLVEAAYEIRAPRAEVIFSGPPTFFAFQIYLRFLRLH
jgi:D-alanyl-lipoteichoic acid acyltransferase DltB (MBOAT superfamily)